MVDLSGGQWQRIAVARGLYRESGILVSDEPTAALDVRVERAIFDTIRSHAQDRTVVLFTHRLAAVTFADRIIVLREGRIVACGTHRELMQQSDYYRELYLLHASSYAGFDDCIDHPSDAIR